MTDRSSIIRAFPLVADALGRRYGVKVLISGQRAYTNGTDIHLPSLPLDADETVLKLARGYLDHEAAHLRITDFGVLQAASLTNIEKNVWNIIEDYMVENRLAEIYPGCHENFIWLIRHLFLKEKDRCGQSEEHDASIIFNWLLISLRALAVPELENERDNLAKAIDNSYAGLRSKLDEVVQAVPSTCFTTSDCISTAKKIVEIIKDYVSSQPHPQNKKNQSSTGNDKAVPEKGGNTGSHILAKNAAGKSKEATEDAGNAHAEQENERDLSRIVPARISDLEEHTDMEVQSNSLWKILNDISELPDQDISAMAAKMLEGICQYGTDRRLTVAICRPCSGISLSGEDVAKIRKTTMALRTRLAALLQAEIIGRNCIGRSGRIETRQIAKLATGDDRIFSRHGVKQGISTAVHILLDASASMRHGDKITLASHACYAVADALQNIPGIGVAVTSFPNGLYSPDGEDQPSWATVASILAHKQKIHTKFNIAANGGTPMAEAIWRVMQQMCRLKEDRRLLLILSDGEPDEITEAITAINACRAHGIEVYGIGIQTSAMRRLLPENRAHALYDINELAPAMFELLRATLVHKKGETNENAA